jgi:hypothetical protein
MESDTSVALIVELVLPDMSIEASHGSHFFHNLFSMGVAYLTVVQDKDYVNWPWLDSLPLLQKLEYFEVRRHNKAFNILFDGKNSVIKKE